MAGKDWKTECHLISCQLGRIAFAWCYTQCDRTAPCQCEQDLWLYSKILKQGFGHHYLRSSKTWQFKNVEHWTLWKLIWWSGCIRDYTCIYRAVSCLAIHGTPDLPKFILMEYLRDTEYEPNVQDCHGRTFSGSCLLAPRTGEEEEEKTILWSAFQFAWENLGSSLSHPFPEDQ